MIFIWDGFNIDEYDRLWLVEKKHHRVLILLFLKVCTHFFANGRSFRWVEFEFLKHTLYRLHYKSHCRGKCYRSLSSLTVKNYLVFITCFNFSTFMDFFILLMTPFSVLTCERFRKIKLDSFLIESLFPLHLTLSFNIRIELKQYITRERKANLTIAQSHNCNWSDY
jgi:hypothetical protein